MNNTEFGALVTPYQRELHAYCYRMLGSLADAEDALQDTLLGAFRGLPGFEGRSALRSWLFRIATHACLRVLEKRPMRQLPTSFTPPATSNVLDAIVQEPVWLEPYPDGEDDSYALRESVELSFVAALQHLPANQRAVLVLRDVLDFSALEAAALLETSVAAINSSLVRARESVAERVPARSQQATLRSLGDDATRSLVAAYVGAWQAGDVTALVALLTRDAKFSMPPIPTWFDGQPAIGSFFAERIFATAWRLVPVRASGQIAFACYQGPAFGLGALNVVTLRDGAISHMTGFLDPATHARFNLPPR